MDILDDMLAGIGWTMQDYLKHGENDYYPPLANGHRLFLHDIRRVAVRCAVAMGEEGDVVVSSLYIIMSCFFLFWLLFGRKIVVLKVFVDVSGTKAETYRKKHHCVNVARKYKFDST